VNLTSAGKEVTVGAGEVSHVKPKAKPDKPSRALRKVLLAVAWPKEKQTRERMIALSGKVEVGSRLMVHGRVVEPDSSGKFKVKVPLRQGKQKVAVIVTDPMGRTVTDSNEIESDANIDVNKEGKLWQRRSP
jgi:hypothetical protein